MIFWIRLLLIFLELDKKIMFNYKVCYVFFFIGFLSFFLYIINLLKLKKKKKKKEN